jgi:hypothetical protein
MSSTVVDASTRSRVRSAARLFDPGGPATLDDLVTAFLEGEPGGCLVCGAEVPDTREGEAALDCPSCGSRLE